MSRWIARHDGPYAVNGRWPATLWLIRHGESAGNVARDAAHAGNLPRIAIAGRDVDVALSPLGHEQAAALGRWFAEGHEDGRPDVVIASPYVRARQTAEGICTNGGTAIPGLVVGLDERLREKEFGILDGLTTTGILAEYPDQAELRRVLGKFYHRPPGGESWCDVIFRLRSLMDMIALHHAGRRVMIVAHQVVVLCLRYVIEHLTEEEILAIDAAGDVANCSVTEYRFDPGAGPDGALALVRYNATAPMTAADATVTDAPDPMVAARG